MHGVNAILGAAISTVFVEMPVTMPLTWHLDFHNHPQHAGFELSESFQALETPYLVKNQLLTAPSRFASSLPFASHSRLLPRGAFAGPKTPSPRAPRLNSVQEWPLLSRLGHKQTAARVCGNWSIKTGPE